MGRLAHLTACIIYAGLRKIRDLQDHQSYDRKYLPVTTDEKYRDITRRWLCMYITARTEFMENERRH
jgi:hypothetical protein